MNFNGMKILILLLGDIFLLYGALLTTLILRYIRTSGELISYEFNAHFIPFTLVFSFWILIFGAFGLYDLRFIKNSKTFSYRLLRAIATCIILAVIVFYSYPIGIEPRRNLILIALITIAYLFIWRYVFNLLVIKTRALKVLFLGVSSEAISLADYLLKNPQLGHRPVGFISDNSLSQAGTFSVLVPHYNLSEKSISEITKEAGADIIVITPETKNDPKAVGALFQVVPLGISVVEFPDYHEARTGKVPLSLIREVWFLENLIGKANPGYEFVKRVVDLILALALGSILLVLLPAIALFILISTPLDILSYRKKRARPGDGVIFFRQTRVGKNGGVFDFIKFRTYVLGAEKMSEAKEVADDRRRYFFGSLLRKSYLDELPQVWNVLKGEMSFIGPRPERPEYVEELKQKVPFYEMRLLVPPGITGWAQINMENDASVEDAPEKMQYDLYYIKNQSIFLDLLIGLRTAFAILGRTGR